MKPTRGHSVEMHHLIGTITSLSRIKNLFHIAFKMIFMLLISNQLTLRKKYQ